MGSFYVSFVTRGPDQAAVAKCLQSAKRKAFVSLTIKAITVFFDKESDTQKESVIASLGQQASKELKAPVLAVLNHDDDILAYWLFDGGNLIDEYNSCPGYFTDGDNTPTGGDAKRLCAAFAVPREAEAMNRVLHVENTKPWRACFNFRGPTFAWVTTISTETTSRKGSAKTISSAPTEVRI